MATLTHSQYNSPMALYSKQNVQEALGQASGYPGRPQSAMGGYFDPSQSRVYRYLHNGDRLSTVHSARYEERPNNDPLPRYRGFVDPTVQSPSFKKLQYVTGVDSAIEDETIPAQVHPPVQFRTDQIQHSRQNAIHHSPVSVGYTNVQNGIQHRPHFEQYHVPQTKMDNWRGQYSAPRFDVGIVPGTIDRTRARSAGPISMGGQRYGGKKEMMKPFIAPNLRYVYDDELANRGQYSYPTMRPEKTNIADYGPYGRATTPHYTTQVYNNGTQCESYGIGHNTGVINGTMRQAQNGFNQNMRLENQTETAARFNRQSPSAQRVWVNGRGNMGQSMNTWPGEEAARRQRRILEDEVKKRAVEDVSVGREVVTATPTSWRHRSVPKETVSTTYTNSVGPRWQQAPGAETKTQSTYSYVDPSGHPIQLTKEIYTSSDPGKEFSMLTEQERKVSEKEFKPGLLSRHITTKYYKKSTYTSTNSTGTTQTSPMSSNGTNWTSRNGYSRDDREGSQF